MSRRGRAVGFLALALLAAVAAAAIADGYGSRVARGYGALRPVVVLDAALRPGRSIGPDEAEGALAVRRVPGRFVPPDALASPAESLGLAPKTALPPGSYLLASQLAPPRRAGANVATCIEPRMGGGCRSRLGRGRRPVEISVSGAGALLAAGLAPTGARVDVVVTSEPAGAGPGRTYVAAAGVPLLALRPGTEGVAGVAAATLGLTKWQALRLIAAESFARGVTLLPGIR